MADQTTQLTGVSTVMTDTLDEIRVRKSHGRREDMGPIQGVTEGASSVLSDAFDLAELQGKLLIADSKDCVQLAKAAVLGLVLALALLIASLPVVAIGLAHLLAWGFEWPLWICQLAVGLFFTVLGLVIGFLCIKRLKSSLAAFKTTQHEAAENIRWFRKALSRTFPF